MHVLIKFCLFVENIRETRLFDIFMGGTLVFNQKKTQFYTSF